ncbi:MAG TPA: hypothetical protein PLV42_08160 [bacterium]|nr:hypothetical protein [bacterium]
MPVRIEAQERADLNNLQRVDGAWQISRHRPYLYLPKVLAYEGFEREELFLLLHSCFLVDRDGGGHLFLATSGTGKSTLARKMRGLMTGGNDETNILYRRNGVLFVASTPFYTIPKLKQAVISNITAPLKRICLLQKESAAHSHIGAVITEDALWRYLVEGQVSTPYTRREYFGAYHRMVNDLCDNYPVRPFFHNLTDPPERITTLLESEYR